MTSGWANPRQGAEGGCNYEVVEKGSTILPPLQKPKKVGHPVAVGGHTVAVGEVIKAVDVVRKLLAGARKNPDRKVQNPEQRGHQCR